MLARDLMTIEVVSIGPDMPVREIADLLLEHRISAVPVLDGEYRVLGIVSEGDLIHRLGGDLGSRSWWLDLLASPEARAHDYLRAHGRLARDVMSAPAITAQEATPVAEIARLLQARRIRRVPVVRDEETMVGLVSRADLLRALFRQAGPAHGAGNDRAIQEQIIARIRRAGLDERPFVDVSVTDGVVQLSGVAGSADEARALALIAE